MSASSTASFTPYGTPITLDKAKKVMEAAEKEARAQGWPMAIAIFDSAGHLVMLQKMDQTQHASVEIAQLKAQTAVNFRRPTKALEDVLAAGGAGLKLLSMPMITVEGGLPILQDGKIIGAIGVSGMQSSQDADVARAGIAALGQS